MLCATFPAVPVVALTATASKEDIMAIKESLNLKNPLEIVANPNRPDIMYKKIFRKGNDVDFYKKLLKPMANDLKQSKTAYPLTILYLPLKWCGFAYKYLVMSNTTPQVLSHCQKLEFLHSTMHPRQMP